MARSVPTRSLTNSVGSAATSAGAARRRPAAQPPVAATSAATSSTPNTYPVAASMAAASSAVNRSCSARTSTRLPAARSLPRGIGGSRRPDSTTRTCGGRSRSNVRSPSTAAGSFSSSVLSRTTVSGSGAACRPSATAARKSGSADGSAESARSCSGLPTATTGQPRSAPSRIAQNPRALSSMGDSDTHTVCTGSVRSQSTSSAVFPHPAGALTSTTSPGAASSSRSSSRWRVTLPDRSHGIAMRCRAAGRPAPARGSEPFGAPLTAPPRPHDRSWRR